MVLSGTKVINIYTYGYLSVHKYGQDTRKEEMNLNLAGNVRPNEKRRCVQFVHRAVLLTEPEEIHKLLGIHCSTDNILVCQNADTECFLEIFLELCEVYKWHGRPWTTLDHRRTFQYLNNHRQM